MVLRAKIIHSLALLKNHLNICQKTKKSKNYPTIIVSWWSKLRSIRTLRIVIRIARIAAKSPRFYSLLQQKKRQQRTQY